MGSSVSEDVAPEGDGESRTLTFAELKDLIEQGKTGDIPNNRIIPEAINVSGHCRTLIAALPNPAIQDAPPSESVAPARRKPWETAT